MKTTFIKCTVAFAAVLVSTACGTRVSAGSASTTPMGLPSHPALRLLQTIPLPNVEGRIDHLAIDIKGQRLFIAALGNNSVEVVDLRVGKVIQSISGFSEPQGVI